MRHDHHLLQLGPVPIQQAVGRARMSVSNLIQQLLCIRLVGCVHESLPIHLAAKGDVPVTRKMPQRKKTWPQVVPCQCLAKKKKFRGLVADSLVVHLDNLRSARAVG